MPLDEVLTEEVSSLQQTLAVAEGPRQDMTVTCKQGEVTFVFTKGEQRFFQGKNMTQPARCPECRKWIREKRAETAIKNRFQDSPSGPKFKTAIPWIESGSLVRDFWSAVEYGGIPEFLGRLRARGHALMAKWGQDILLGKNGKQRDFSSLSSWMQWQCQLSLELCQIWQPQMSATDNAISWNLGPLGIHAA